MSQVLKSPLRDVSNSSPSNYMEQLAQRKRDKLEKKKSERLRLGGIKTNQLIFISIIIIK